MLFRKTQLRKALLSILPFMAILFINLFSLPKSFADSDNCPDRVSYDSANAEFTFHYNGGVPVDGNGDTPYTRIELEISGGKGAGKTVFVNVISISSYKIVTDDAGGKIDGTSEVKYVGSTKHRITYFKGTTDLNKEKGNKKITHCYGDLPLPVTWMSVQVSSDETHRNTVSWTTATEINNHLFEVERSFDGKEWFKVGDVVGAGNSNTQKHYLFVDAILIKTRIYYRVKQVDFDGGFDYSPIVSTKSNIDLINMAIMTIYPNPSSNQASMLHFQNIENAKIEIFDVSGRIIYQTFSEEELDRIILPNLPNGMYNVTVSNRNIVLNHRYVVKE